MRKQCSGPYRLAGWGFGGLLAYEIASQLIARDEEVAFLGLIDSPAPPGRTHSLPAGYPGDSAEFEAYLGNYAGPDIEQFRRRLSSHYDALATYRPEPLGISVDLFLAAPLDDVPPDARPSLYCGWETYIPPTSIRIERIAAAHDSIIGASTLGDAIWSALRRVTAQTSAVSSDQYLVEIQSGAKGNAHIVCVPGAGDNVTAFVDFARAFQTGISISALQPRGLSYPEVPHATVESAAKAYVKALDMEPITGSLHLIGHSFGGWVAFEMACIMAYRGTPPSSLTIIDAAPPVPQTQEYPSYTVFQDWVRRLERQAGRSFDLKPAIAEGNALDRIRAVHEKLVEFGEMPPASRPEVLRGPLRTFAAALRTSYMPAMSLMIPVKFALVDDPSETTELNLRRQDEWYREWCKWAPLSVRWRGPGNHQTILNSPHVDELVSWWQLNQQTRVVSSHEKDLQMRSKR